MDFGPHFVLQYTVSLSVLDGAFHPVTTTDHCQCVLHDLQANTRHKVTVACSLFGLDGHEVPVRRVANRKVVHFTTAIIPQLPPVPKPGSDLYRSRGQRSAKMLTGEQYEQLRRMQQLERLAVSGSTRREASGHGGSARDSGRGSARVKRHHSSPEPSGRDRAQYKASPGGRAPLLSSPGRSAREATQYTASPSGSGLGVSARAGVLDVGGGKHRGSSP